MDRPQADSSQVPLSQGTVPRAISCVLTALRTRMIISPGTGPDVEVITETSPWQFHNVATNRVTFTNLDASIRTYLELEDGRGSIRLTVAASDGIIYAVYGNATHVVCNLQLMIVHSIPAPPAPVFKYNTVAMVVDAVTHRYRIVLTGCGYSLHPASNAGLMEVILYDSRDTVWRTLCTAPAVACAPLSSVVLDGVLYAMFEIVALPGRPFELYSCDLDTGAWLVNDVSLPWEPRQSIKTRPQLVVASGRLFFVGYLAPAGVEAVITVSIWHIALQGEGTVTGVALLPGILEGCNQPEYWATAAPVQAVGCGDSIVVTTFLGDCWRWDVVLRTWHAMAPFSPVEPLAAGHSFFVAHFERPMTALQ